jgi:glycine/D-amino acid oxidase-like deaminating enzyme
MEFAGYDRSLNRTRLDALEKSAQEYLQSMVSGTIEEEWFGWRPMTSDDLPIIGRAPGFNNLTLATGHGMLGLSLAPITGLLVTELLDGSPSSVGANSQARFQVRVFRLAGTAPSLRTQVLVAPERCLLTNAGYANTSCAGITALTAGC